MPSTTNFSWTTPADTDYVKDGASAIRTLANGIDTSMAQLKGGTTGQILSKTSGTDMAFTWINNDQGDLTAITAGTGISVTSGTGPIPTVAIDTATTVDKTTAQTLTNKTLTAPVISTISNTGTLTLPTSTDTLVGRATTDTLTNKTLTSPVISSISNTGTLTLPTSTDTLVGRATTDTLTNKTISASSNTLTGVINNTLTTTTGDLIYASSANTPARLGIGSSSQVLTVSGGVPTWATPASAGGMTSISSGSLSSGGTSITSISGSYVNLRLVIKDWYLSTTGVLAIKINNNTTLTNYTYLVYQSSGTNSATFYYYNNDAVIVCNYSTAQAASNNNITVINFPHYTETTGYKLVDVESRYVASAGTEQMMRGMWDFKSTSAITQLDIYASAGTISGGSYVLYGVK